MKADTMQKLFINMLSDSVQELYSGTKFRDGGVTENGFYCDFDFSKIKNFKLSPENFGKIQKKMRGMIKSSKKKIPVDAFKVTKIAGAYWKGDKKNKMLTRVYGIAFETKEKLEKYLEQQAEAEKRDHRVLGKKLDLFIFSDLIGKGLPLLTPRGTIIRQELEKFIIEEETKRGYLRTCTPDLAKVDLYKKSGHWQHYKDSMYPPINVDGEDYVLRPMACPHHFMLYNSKPRSYRELPIRYTEIVKQYRKEQSGELSGLMRVMCFSLVDAHIICKPSQIEKEFEGVLKLIQYSMKVLGIKDYWYRFSKWDSQDKKKYINNPKAWKQTEFLMKKILDKLKVKYIPAKGEAAFYGPKLDIQMKNVNGKEDTAFTVQIDFALPEKFDMTYVDEKGKQQRPMVIHRSSIGSIERTMAFLIEYYAGAFPLWLSPVQISIIPITSKHAKYAHKISEKFQNLGFRFEVADDNETVGKKIRESEMQKIPYIIVVGDKEQKSKTISIRERSKNDIKEMKLDKFLEKITKQREDKI